MPQIASKNHNAILSLKFRFSQIYLSRYFFPAELEKLLADYPTDLNTPADNQNAVQKAFEICDTFISTTWFFQRWYCLYNFPEHSLLSAVLTLHEKGLFKKDWANFEALIVSDAPLETANGLVKLFKAGLLEEDSVNREVFVGKSSPEKIANALIEMHQEGLLTPDNRNALRAGNDNTKELRRAIKVLKNANLLTSDFALVNFTTIVPFAELLFNYHLYELWKYYRYVGGQISQNNFNALVQPPLNEELVLERVLSLLFSNPAVFAYAEPAQQYYLNYIVSFIAKKLASWHEDHRNGVFDRTESTLCVHVMRHLIRQNDRRLNFELLFLAGIPAVRECAVREESNDLLQFARRVGNFEAVRILSEIPAWRYRAQNPIHEPPPLRMLAGYRESSMRALTEEEENRLKAVTALYQPRIAAKGEKKLMQELQHQLQTRYAQNPAVIFSGGRPIVLPLEYAAFRALRLSATDEEYALQAYYLNKNHSAWRYLSKPNFWISAEAEFVCIDPANPRLRWANFENYQYLIVLLWVAAQDENIPPVDGHTLESRLGHFIQELAAIGRAHNWDKTREFQGKEEEYDDGERDKPSCELGVKRRLFQSVIGHPLLKIITQNDIKHELRDFVRNHFQTCIQQGDARQLKAAFDKYIISTENLDALPLKALDISESQQSEFIAALHNKYEAQFSDAPSFTNYIQQEFNLCDRDYAHALKFAHFGLDELLNAALKSHVGQANFFSSRTVHTRAVREPSYSSAP